MANTNHNPGLDGLRKALESALTLDSSLGTALRFLSGEEGREVQHNSLTLCRDRLEQALFDLEKVCGKKVSAGDCRDRAADLAGRLKAIAEDGQLMGGLTEVEANLVREALACAGEAEAAVSSLIEEGLSID